MKLRKRNYAGETWHTEQRRRCRAIEIHLSDLEFRLAEAQDRVNLLREMIGLNEDDSDNTGQERSGDNRADSLGDKEFRGSQQGDSRT